MEAFRICSSIVSPSDNVGIVRPAGPQANSPRPWCEELMISVIFTTDSMTMPLFVCGDVLDSFLRTVPTRNAPQRCVLMPPVTEDNASPTHGVTFLTDLPESFQPTKKAAPSILALLKREGPSSVKGKDVKFLEKIHFAPPAASADYYDSFPMSPGVDYLGSLVQFRSFERMQMMLANLRVRWPKTWCFCGLDTYLFNSVTSRKKGITVK